MSLDDSRNQILSYFDEEKVEVNQRLLVDKILARYSSEFAIYRELMQNSDDAKSSSIQILFQTENNKMENKIRRITFKNNGFSFRPEDWNRLKQIAEGNPDEQKIGAFGVGFYSLFSVCENPFVSSGGQGMAFYWRENQLFTKQGPIEDKDKGWTTFMLDMREPIKFPGVEEFAQYFANSLGFTVNLQEISVYFNDTLVIQLSKKMQKPKLMNITRDINTFSPLKMFNLTSVDVRDVQLDVKYQTEEASMYFRIASGNLDVRVSDTFSANMERITKKKPPSKTTIQMIFTGFEEYNTSGEYNRNISPVFKDLLKFPEQGRIYIGFSTQQTTGCCSHLAARVIPTMERESIDLANKILAEYNNEMLCLAGTLCRILYEDEMAQIAWLYNETISAYTEDDEEIDSIRELIERRAAYTLKYFTFNPSTPNEQVGIVTESQFFSCLKQKLSILSTNGVLPISDIRMPNSEMVGFMKKVPVVPKILLEQCDTFFDKAENVMNLIKELTLHDVLYELESRTLSEDEMIELLKWWISYRSKGNVVNSLESAQFMQLAHIGDRSRALNTIHYYLNPEIITPYIDVPIEVLPHAISKKLHPKKDLETWFGWSELTLVNWARFIVNNPELESDPIFARKVHQILAKSLNNTSQNDQKIIKQLFVQKKCIPTIFGMKIPNETYFQDVTLFPDLPTIQFQRPSSVKNIMELLGVRKVVDLQIIFNRLNGQGNFDHMQLVKYLSSILNDLQKDDIMTLKNKPIWPKENLTDSESNNNEFENIYTKTRFIARELYTPIALHREFGLPVIDWKGRWFRSTLEGKFLIELGLKEYSTLNEILELAAPPTDSVIRDKAFKYFINNFEEKYSKDYDPAKVNIAFLPCSNPNIYAKPTDCFINPECMIMKFQAIRQDLQFHVGKFGVCQHPSNVKLLNRLSQDPPQDPNNAKKIFEYLASRQAEFTSSDWETLAFLKFIPIKYDGEIILTNPRSCFFKVEEELNDFFTCVDFGEQANKFLRNFGVKNEPASIDFIELLVKSSHKLLSSIGKDKYMDILRKIAIDYGKFESKVRLIAEMKKAPILTAMKKTFDYESSEVINQYSLASANKIFINDDKGYQGVFNPLTAPEDEYLENLYKKLGCRSLHESVKETSIQKGTIRETRKSQQLQETIIERASLFYFKHPKHKVRRNEEWLKKLKVKEIDYIETCYKLDNAVTIKKNDTSILQDRGMDSWTLYITSKSNMLDISQHIVKNIYKPHEWNNIFCINTLLTAPLSSLNDIGYPVDRILQQHNLKHIIDQLKSDSISQSHDPNSILKNSLKNKKPVAITPETIQGLQNRLHNAIKACNSNSGSNIDNQASIQIGSNESQMNYCEILPGHSLSYIKTLREIEIYVSKGFDQSEILSQSLSVPLHRFINILKNLADVFNLSSKVLHIFYDENTSTIAFNRGGALFFNFSIYLRLHDEKCKIKPTIYVMAYWFMTFCHELAHNVILPHNSDHEHYFSSFAEFYMSNFLAILKNCEIN